MISNTLLIKVGGSVLNDPVMIQSICDNLQILHDHNISIILVHGGGKAIDQALKIHHLSSQMIDGLRVTTDPMMDIIEMVLSGKVNQQLVRSINATGIPAMGLSGTDQNLLLCEALNPMYGRVGKISQVNTEFLSNLIQFQQLSNINMIPVIAPIGVDLNGNAFNINADWVAATIAIALKMNTIMFMTDQPGIYDHENSMIPQLSVSKIKQMINAGIINNGMLVKANAIIHALENGINYIHIIKAPNSKDFANDYITGKIIGTTCTRDALSFSNKKEGHDVTAA